MKAIICQTTEVFIRYYTLGIIYSQYLFIGHMKKPIHVNTATKNNVFLFLILILLENLHLVLLVILPFCFLGERFRFPGNLVRFMAHI